ncbi:hypothetical protein GUJ93_ZPchr0011g28291 [Zizania palustris]|uniref:Uncharacterized protein n=1 Tax=Zizania palustris TaxID=103762 RepID=A0A8J5WLE9_ZIZPA|nr:hypothetical protein GUJ93_ZPchr0011g28291 [Zizania palustris]
MKCLPVATAAAPTASAPTASVRRPLPLPTDRYLHPPHPVPRCASPSTPLCLSADLDNSVGGVACGQRNRASPAGWCQTPAAPSAVADFLCDSRST